MSLVATLAVAPQGSDLAQLLAASAADHSSAWPGDLRNGVASILRSRAPPATRQAALVLASAAVDLCGPSWLLGTAGKAKVRGPGLDLTMPVRCVGVSSQQLTHLSPCKSILTLQLTARRWMPVAVMSGHGVKLCRQNLARSTS